MKGSFQTRGHGDALREVFVLVGSELELDAESVSSEWTAESQEETEGRGDAGTSSRELIKKEKDKKRQKVRHWRVRHSLRRKRSDSGSESSSCSVSGSSRDSSSTSSGSSSSSGEVARFKRQRLELLKNWKASRDMGVDCDDVQVAAAEETQKAELAETTRGECVQPIQLWKTAHISPATELQWHTGPKRYRCFAVAPGFLCQKDIQEIQTAAKHRSVKEINDRKGYLAFKHRVWRFELQLHSLYPQLYFRLLALMRFADEAKWRRMRAKSTKVYPEIEYIEYDVAEMGEPCFIEPHVDNKSAVTMVAMLSAPEDFVGGVNCFRRADGRTGHRHFSLARGDIVLFRGEKLVHWITPVTAGKRVILQIELSRV